MKAITSKSRSLFFSACLLLSLLFASISLAHEVWIEDSPEGELWLRFAEYGDEFEKSPGALDGLSIPLAFTPSTEGKFTALAAEKKKDGYLLTGAIKTAPALAETAYAVTGKEPARLPFFYARWHAGDAAAQPALTFDLVPTGTRGEVRVFFRGEPVAGAKVTLYAPGADEQEIVADQNGFARFTAQKSGLYLLTARHHREPSNGFRGGKPYQAVSHNCSLAWRQP